MTTPRPPKVVFYEPYAAWPLHGHTAGLLATGLKARGADVTFVACDGLFSDCSLYRESLGSRPVDACLACQADVIGIARKHMLDLTWLGRYLRIEEQRSARAWVDSLTPEQLGDAVYGEWRLGEWLSYSIHCHIRDAYPDRSDPHVIAVRRSFIRSGLIACFALDRLLNDLRPDVLVTFHGRLASTRLACELAALRGVRRITHYRAPRGEELSLIENDLVGSIKVIDSYWEQWAEVPLSAAENEELDRYLFAVEDGNDPTVTSFVAPDASRELAHELGLQSDRPVWALFMSSAEDDHVFDAHTPLPSQYEWLRATIEYVRSHPEVDLIIRAHPNIGSARSPGVNRRQLAELKELNASLPANAMIVDPDSKIDSYALMDCATAGIIWGTTAGLEMAVRGKPVVAVSPSFIYRRPYAHSVMSAEEYPAALNKLLRVRPGTIDPEIARAARRHAYGIFCRLHLPFPLIRATGFNEGELLACAGAALGGAQSSVLDRICGVIMAGEPACPPPTDDELRRSTDAEDRFLERLGGRHVTVLAFADELIADVSLLEAWADAFDGHDQVTLFIYTPETDIARLIEVVARAGLDHADGLNLVAGELDKGATASVAAVFSRIDRGSAPEGAPRYDPGSLRELIRSISRPQPSA